MHNLAGGDLAWEFTKEHWGTMLARFPENSIVRMCEGITALATPELEADVTRFFADHPVPAAGKTLDQHLERLHVNVVFKQREASALESAFPPAGPERV
jgi:puromycin-sensitive aminopeptidase